MSYEIVGGSLSGLGAFGGPGDRLGESCLCGGSGACTSASAQATALPTLRAAMAAAGLPTRTGNWTTAEAAALNAFASAHGQPTSSKFLVDGGPCRALKAALTAPAPVPAGTTTTGGVTCASLLSQAPPIPAGTPIDSVIKVLEQLAPPGFDVRACVTAPTPAGGGSTVVPALDPGTAAPPAVVVPPASTESGTSPLLILGLGLAAVVAVGGVAYAATRPKGMRQNGKRRRARRGMRQNGATLSDAAKRNKTAYHAGYRAGTARSRT